MARKTLSISEEAYKALYRFKGKNESLSEAVLRLAGRGAKGSLLEYVRSTTPSKQVANNIEKILKGRNSVQVRSLHEETVRKRQMRKAAEATDRLRERLGDAGWSGAREIRKWRDSRQRT
jgi:predicted CopG family antitoxin